MHNLKVVWECYLVLKLFSQNLVPLVILEIKEGMKIVKGDNFHQIGRNLVGL